MAVLGFGERLARNRYGVAYDRSITVLVVVVWLILFIVQAAQIGCTGGRGPSITGVYFGSQGYCVRYKDGSVEACTLERPVMLPVGFLVRLKTVSARPYAAPVLKAVTDPSAYRRASVWLRFYPK